MRHTLLLSLRLSVAATAAAVLGLGLLAAGANAATPAASVVTASASPQAAPYRQLLGTVTASTYLEASVPRAGKYAIEYDITANAAFFDTYVDGTELGYVGGSTGTYLTRAVQLSASGHLVQVAGPEGVGTANVYLVAAK